MSNQSNTDFMTTIRQRQLRPAARIILIALTGSLLLAPSCKSKKNISKKTATTTQVTGARSTGSSAGTATGRQTPSASETTATAKDAAVRQQAPAGSIAACALQTGADIKGVNVSKMSATVHVGGRQVTTSMSLKLAANERLMVSVQPMLGIEMFRLEADRTQIVVIDKLGSRYCAMTYSELQQRTGIPMSFDDLQNLICARLFAVGKPDYFNQKKTAWKESGQKDVSTISFTVNGVAHEFALDKSCRVTSCALQKSKKANVRAKYADYTTTADAAYPQQVSLEGVLGSLSLQCEIDVKRVSFGAQAISAYDLKKLKRVEINQLLNR